MPPFAHRSLSLLPALLLALLLLRVQAQAWDGDRLRQSAERLGPKAVAGWLALEPVLRQAAAADAVARLQLINDFFNRRIHFQDDTETWGQVDYWASPLETLSQGEGDCEDYAIAKYFSLVAAGTPVAQLRLVYVQAQVAGRVQAHMVLAWYASAEADPLVLDNLNPAVQPASTRRDLLPVFSFNGEGLWQGATGASAGDPLARLSRWRGVVAKAQAEGFR